MLLNARWEGDELHVLGMDFGVWRTGRGWILDDDDFCGDVVRTEEGVEEKEKEGEGAFVLLKVIHPKPGRKDFLCLQPTFLHHRPY